MSEGYQSLQKALFVEVEKLILTKMLGHELMCSFRIFLMAFKGLCQTNMGAIIFTTCKLQRYDIHSNIDVDSFSQAMFWVKKFGKKGLEEKCN